MTARSLALDGGLAPDQSVETPRVEWMPVPGYWIDVDACAGRLRWAGESARRCVLTHGHDGDHVFETAHERDAREHYHCHRPVELPALEIPPTQVAPRVTQTTVSETPLMSDGVYTDFTFVPREGMLQESDLQIGQRVRMDARPLRGPLVEGEIVSLTFDVRARKCLVRVRA